MERLNSFRMADQDFEEELGCADLVDLLGGCQYNQFHKNKRHTFF